MSIELDTVPSYIYVSYYDYMKLFTHTCDDMKAKDDPTKVSDYGCYETVLPDTMQQWEEDIEILEKNRNLSIEERIKLADRRCLRKLKEEGEC